MVDVPLSTLCASGKRTRRAPCPVIGGESVMRRCPQSAILRGLERPKFSLLDEASAEAGALKGFCCEPGPCVAIEILLNRRTNRQ